MQRRCTYSNCKNALLASQLTKLIKTSAGSKFFSSAMQAIAVQIIGNVFFYIISVYLSKTDFGTLSWMNAVCLVITAFLGLGLEQVVVRRVATSRLSDWAAFAFLLHSVVGFAAAFLLLLLLRNLNGIFNVLPWFFLAQGLIYIGVPLKSFFNAKEQFTPYGIIALVSNTGKIAAVYFLLYRDKLNLHTVIAVLIAAAAFEWLCLAVCLVIKTRVSFSFRFKAYVKLVKEALPQYGAVIFDVALSRMDWILLGIISTNVVLADYSFAYRAFELARLPMLIVAPVILPRLARLMAVNSKDTAADEQLIASFARVELFFAMLIPLILNILWVPLVSLITKGKYGDSNATQFLVLSMCIPLQFFINLLWSISFGAKKYKQVSAITVSSAAVNIVLNLLLIPYMGGMGAAIAFLITTLLQAGLYYRLLNKSIMAIPAGPGILFIVTAITVYGAVTFIHVHYLVRLLIAVSAYIAILLLLKQINRKHLYHFKHFLSR